MHKRYAQATENLKNKLLKYGIRTVVIVVGVGLVGYIVFVSNFSMFDTPKRTTLTYRCDHQGLRRVEVYRLAGNAVTNPSIHLSVQLGCDNYKPIDEIIIFTADEGSIADKDVNISFITFDTLTVEYKQGLRVFTKLNKVVFADSTLNLNVTYKELR